jgi:plastocyanin
LRKKLAVPTSEKGRPAGNRTVTILDPVIPCTRRGGIRFSSRPQRRMTMTLSNVEKVRSPAAHYLARAILAIAMVICPNLARATTFDVSVADGGLFFFPNTLAIQVGDTVKWTWIGSGHSTTSGTPGSPDGNWDSGILSSGATFSHTFGSAGTFPYYCMPHGACCAMVGTVTVNAPTPTPTPSPTPAAGTLANISTRLAVETGDNVLIGGFIITGTDPISVLVRAIGPSLPVTGPLADPTLELHDGTGTLIATNDDWMDAPNEQDIIDTTIPPTAPAESAILMDLPPDSYTAIVSGVNATTGVGLVEAYDLALGANSRLANISTRGLVQTGDDVLIGGFIIVGGTAQEVLVRAIGPSLPVDGALADPMLELHDLNGAIIASNDDWRSDQEAEIIATTIPPGDDAESAILVTLSANPYTAIVRGKNNTTGVALVEAYGLAP